ncbi:MAG TPA: YMGG-like glycine zipper-containing protein [Gammaproteobacteria bacterium]|nr:YMGG-like glycine zipper-containing protein [Gammaproteobacteria bacterium]
MLKRTIVIGLLVVGGLMLNGCADTRTNRTLAGAGIGAVGGGLIGNAVGGSTGTIVGAGAGAVGGGLIGHNY